MTLSTLLSPCSVGPHTLTHRVVLAPMTRTRADAATLAPTEQTVLYYAQRASLGGLLISEATHISPEATPSWTIYQNVRDDGGHVPGIWTDTQVARWRAVCDAVHDKGAVISCQLLHAGRVAQPGIGLHPIVVGTNAPLPPVSSSATALCADTEAGDYNWDQAAVLPRALTSEDIVRLIDDYRHAARNACRAGFDFVELHAAHGYLIEQFLCDGINQRTDRYGGSVLNRCRLLFDVVAALVDECGAKRVGVRLSPTGVDPATGRYYQTYFGATTSDPEAIYDCAVAGLNDFPLAYLMLTEPRVGALSVAPEVDPSNRQPLRNGRFRSLFKGCLIGAGGFIPKTAEQAIADGYYDLIAFGRWFLANPDLPDRLRDGSPLNVYDRATFYGCGAAGYIDYPDRHHTRLPSRYAVIDQAQVGVSLRVVD